MQEQPSSASSSPSSKWAITYSSKLQFFLKIRRLLFFLQPKKPTKILCLQYDTTNNKNKNINKVEPLIERETEEMMQGKIEQVDESGALQRAVKQVLFGNKLEEKENGVKEIKRLASQDLKMRKSLGALGVIPPLVSMLHSHDHHTSPRQLAVQALTQLSYGTFTNKALILEAGILTKLPTNVEEVDEPLTNDLSQLLLSISSIFNSVHCPFNKPTLITFLLSIIQSNYHSEIAKEACLGTLHNLSTVLEISGLLISNKAIEILLNLLSSSQEKVSELALATLGNLVVTLMGKKALEDNERVPEILIDILIWEDKPKCQELSVYILMILGHQSSKQRDRMAKSGIVHTLLEVALLGSPLAQKRALKLLQWFKDERQVVVGAHSGPQIRSLSMGSSPMSDGESSEGRRLMKKMVQQSLHKNMELITRRANAAGQTSKLKSLVISSSSKSLPY